MGNKEFKQLFDHIAKFGGFEYVYGGWYKTSEECIVILELQKSNFGNYYDLNIKIYVQGIFNNNYIINKDLVKKDTGDIFRRQPSEFNSVFDFDEPMNDEERNADLIKLFSDFIVPFTDKALLKSGIKELAEKGEITLLPAVREELYKDNK